MNEGDLHHPGRLDEADRQRHTRNPVPLLAGLLFVIAIVAVMALFDAHGVKR
jgi:UDP-N-acetylmuramyl pentapeptide phosphotransferase/UDP-N-acetylglucosamine-1-phosphate transferase